MIYDPQFVSDFLFCINKKIWLFIHHKLIHTVQGDIRRGTSYTVTVDKLVLQFFLVLWKGREIVSLDLSSIIVILHIVGCESCT